MKRSEDEEDALEQVDAGRLIQSLHNILLFRGLVSLDTLELSISDCSLVDRKSGRS